MNKKSIIVVWKWKLVWNNEDDSWCFHENNISNNDFIKPFDKNKKYFNVSIENDSKEEYKFYGFTKNHSYPEDPNKRDSQIIEFDYQDNDIKKLVEKLKKDNNQILVLLHAGYPDNYNVGENLYEHLQELDNVKVFIFSGNDYWEVNGQQYPYQILLNLYQSDFDINAIVINEEKKSLKIRKENIEKIWKYFYINDAENKYLNKKKNELIKLWLPLAVDLQGLSEFDNDQESYKNYKKEVEKAWDEEKICDLFKEHTKIVEEIEDKIGDNKLKKYKIESKKKLKNLQNGIEEYLKSLKVKKQDKKQDEKQDEKKVKKINTEDEEFLPKYLNDCIEDISKLEKKDRIKD